MKTNLLTTPLTIKEIGFPSQQDKRTIMLNNVLNNIFNVGDWTKHGVTCEFRCNYPGRDYYFYIMTNQYNNPDILWDSIYHLVENVMSWYDLSDIENFEIKVEEGNRRNKCTYYDLAYWGWDRQSVFGNKPFYSEEKHKRIIKWFREKMRNEEKEYNEKMNRALYGGYGMYKNSDKQIIVKPKTFISKIKNLFVNL